MNDLFKQAEWQEGSDSQLQHIIDAVNGPGMRDLGYLINEFRYGSEYPDDCFFLAAA